MAPAVGRRVGRRQSAAGGRSAAPAAHGPLRPRVRLRARRGDASRRHRCAALGPPPFRRSGDDPRPTPRRRDRTARRQDPPAASDRRRLPAARGRRQAVLRPGPPRDLARARRPRRSARRRAHPRRHPSRDAPHAAAPGAAAPGGRPRGAVGAAGPLRRRRGAAAVRRALRVRRRLHRRGRSAVASGLRGPRRGGRRAGRPGSRDGRAATDAVLRGRRSSLRRPRGAVPDHGGARGVGAVPVHPSPAGRAARGPRDPRVSPRPRQRLVAGGGAGPLPPDRPLRRPRLAPASPGAGDGLTVRPAAGGSGVELQPARSSTLQRRVVPRRPAIRVGEQELPDDTEERRSWQRTRPAPRTPTPSSSTA